MKILHFIRPRRISLGLTLSFCILNFEFYIYNYISKKTVWKGGFSGYFKENENLDHSI